MKAYAAFVVIIVAIGLGIWWQTSKVSTDPGQLIGLAFGNETGQTIEMHVVVTMIMSKVEGPKLKGTKTVTFLDWEGWVEDHFELRDAEGQRVGLRRTQNSNLMKGATRLGTPDFYLAADLTPGTQFTLDYVPIFAGGVRYRHSFTAPAERTTFKRHTFALVEP